MTTTFNVLGVAAGMGAGVVGGVFFSFSTFVGAALRTAPPGAAVTTMQAVNVAAVRPPLLLALFGTAALGVAVAVHAVRGGAGGWPAVAGAVTYVVGVVGTTVGWNVPRNDALARWNPAVVDRDRWLEWLVGWQAGNHVRTVASLSAAVLFAVAAARGFRAGAESGA